MTNENEIRELAYSIWEREGRVDGKSEEHWHRASQEVKDQRDRVVTDPVDGELIEALQSGGVVSGGSPSDGMSSLGNDEGPAGNATSGNPNSKGPPVTRLPGDRGNAAKGGSSA